MLAERVREGLAQPNPIDSSCGAQNPDHQNAYSPNGLEF